MEVFGAVEVTPIGPPRFNISPGQDLVVIRDGKLSLVHWGLVPWWSKTGKIPRNCVQARFETVSTAPAFRDAFKERRCLVVVDGFYEWSSATKSRQPHHVRFPEGKPFAIAGVWESWKAPDGKRIETCAVVTTAATGQLDAIHDRMPLVLDGDDREIWMGPDAARAAYDVKVTPRISDLLVIPVSTRVNNVKNDDAFCVVPPEEAPPPAQTTLRFG